MGASKPDDLFAAMAIYIIVVHDPDLATENYEVATEQAALGDREALLAKLVRKVSKHDRDA